MSHITVTGRTALYASTLGFGLRKYADPTAPAADSITADEAADIIAADPALVYAVVDSSDADIRTALRSFRDDAGAAGDSEQVELCDAALQGDTEAMVACLEAMR